MVEWLDFKKVHGDRQCVWIHRVRNVCKL